MNSMRRILPFISVILASSALSACTSMENGASIGGNTESSASSYTSKSTRPPELSDEILSDGSIVSYKSADKTYFVTLALATDMSSFDVPYQVNGIPVSIFNVEGAYRLDRLNFSSESFLSVFVSKSDDAVIGEAVFDGKSMEFDKFKYAYQEDIDPWAVDDNGLFYEDAEKNYCRFCLSYVCDQPEYNRNS